MPWRIIWSRAALRDLNEISDYLLARNPEAALRLERKIVRAVRQLREFPRLARSLEDGTRLLVAASPYLVRYRVEDDRVLVLSVRHGARVSEKSDDDA